MGYCARGANGVDDEIVLMGKDRAQIEFEATVADIANDGRNRMTKRARKILHGAVLGQKIECDRGQD